MNHPDRLTGLFFGGDDRTDAWRSLQMIICKTSLPFKGDGVDSSIYVFTCLHLCSFFVFNTKQHQIPIPIPMPVPIPAAAAVAVAVDYAPEVSLENPENAICALRSAMTHGNAVLREAGQPYTSPRV